MKQKDGVSASSVAAHILANTQNARTRMLPGSIRWRNCKMGLVSYIGKKFDHNEKGG